MSRKSTTKLNFAYATGVPGIDIQHNELFCMCNALQKSLVKMTAPLPDSVYLSVQDIMKHLKSHCFTEESLLEMIGFPKTAEHKIQHKKLFNLFRRQLRALKNKDVSEINSFVSSLRETLINHVSVSDIEFSVHIETLMALRKKFNITALKARVLTE